MDKLREKSEAMKGQAADEFKQHELFDDLLRDNVVKFLDNNTLFNYSQCSRKCNQEIQKYHTTAPEHVEIKETQEGIDVSYGKANRFSVYNNPSRIGIVDASFKFADYASYNEILNSIEAYFARAFRHVNEGTTDRLYISMRHWPVGLMRRGFFPVVEEFDVNIWNTMLDGFVEFANTTNMRVSTLGLNKTSENVVPINGEKVSELLRSALVQRVECIKVELDTAISDEDFLALRNPTIGLSLPHRSISDAAICQKVTQINNSRTVDHEINIGVEDDSWPFDLEAMFPHHFVEREDDEYMGVHIWFTNTTVGRVDLETEGMGTNLTITT